MLAGIIASATVDPGLKSILSEREVLNGLQWTKVPQQHEIYFSWSKGYRFEPQSGQLGIGCVVLLSKADLI